MEKLDHSLPSNINTISALNCELNALLAASDLTIQKYNEIFEQVKVFEARQEYIAASMAEGELIAADILHSARLRIENIEAGAQKTITPQKKQIAWIEKEIKELNQIMTSLKASKKETTPERHDVRAVNSGIISKVFNEEPALEEITESILANQFDFQLPIEPELQLLDVQDMPIPEDISVKANTFFELPGNNIIPTSESNESETTASECSENDKLLMQMDGFIDFSYLEYMILRDHRWQIKAEAIAREDNYEFAGYSKASSAFVSTLQRYNNMTLNEVYPFDLIAPNLKNFGSYLFNCLDDTFSFLDLKLTEITIWENQNLIMTFTSRNLDFDKRLQGEANFVEDLRGIYKTCEIEEEPTRKSIFTQIFKNNN